MTGKLDMTPEELKALHERQDQSDDIKLVRDHLIDCAEYEDNFPGVCKDALAAFDRLCKARGEATEQSEGCLGGVATRGYKPDPSDPTPAEAVNDGLVTDAAEKLVRELEDLIPITAWFGNRMATIIRVKEALLAASNYKPEVMAVNEGMRQALEDAHSTLLHAQIFIRSREKMHRDGQTLYSQTIANIEAALQASDPACKANLPSAREIIVENKAQAEMLSRVHAVLSDPESGAEDHALLLAHLEGLNQALKDDGV